MNYGYSVLPVNQDLKEKIRKLSPLDNLDESEMWDSGGLFYFMSNFSYFPDLYLWTEIP